MKFIRVFFVFILLVLGCVSSARAQNAAIQLLQNSQAQMQIPQPQLRTGTNAPELYTGENEDIGPQYILRVNNQKARRNWFEVTLDSQAYYSDDANYAGHTGRIGSAIFVNTLQGAIAPDPFTLGPGKFAVAAGFSGQLYDYSSHAMVPLDFLAETAFVNLRYFLGNYWQFTAGANYTRLINEGGLGEMRRNETYREWLPNVGLQRAFPINNHLSVIVGDVVDYHFTHVPSTGIPQFSLTPPFTPLPSKFTRDDINDHLDEAIYVTLNWQVTSHLIIQPFYRFQYSYYRFDTLSATPPTQNDRSDWLDSVGLNVVYNFNSYASVRLFCSYNTKSSTDSLAPAYDELNGGLGATLDIKF